MQLVTPLAMEVAPSEMERANGFANSVGWSGIVFFAVSDFVIVHKVLSAAQRRCGRFECTCEATIGAAACLLTRVCCSFSLAFSERR